MTGNIARLGFTELPDWHPQGACNGRPDLDWYSDTPEQIATVKAICAGCPVQVACLQYALDEREAWGVWGGLTPDERDGYGKQVGAVVATITRHGERARYMGSKNVPGCRCDLCTRAHADYEHERRVAVKQRGPNWEAPTKPCKSCGRQFAPRVAKQLHCTQLCRLAKERETREQAMAARRCALCGEPRPPKRYRFCDDDCRDLAALYAAGRKVSA